MTTTDQLRLCQYDNRLVHAIAPGARKTLCNMGIRWTHLPGDGGFYAGWHYVDGNLTATTCQACRSRRRWQRAQEDQP